MKGIQSQPYKSEEEKVAGKKEESLQVSQYEKECNVKGDNMHTVTDGKLWDTTL